jgi:murein DD-endopeptidase MepM/ murein hydrolase activator NlpD
MLKLLSGLVLLLLVAAASIFFIARREAPPLVKVEQPDRAVGQTGTLTVTAETPGAAFKQVTITLEQNGQVTPLFGLEGDVQNGTVTGADRGAFARTGPNTLRISRPFGKQAVPQLKAGPARIVVSATRKSFLNLRTLTTTATRDIQVRLEPPRISVASTHHYVNHGGTEFVVYRATPSDVASGVRVGDVEYPGFQVGSDPAVKAAFFALLYDQELRSKIVAFARDEAGNEATASFIDNVFEKPQKKSRIELDDKFIGRVVPEILEHSPELKLDTPAAGADMVPAFLEVNGELRRRNADQIAAFAKRTAPSRLWDGPFVQLGNSKVEAAFADHRTYLYKGKDIDHQVHLGFDLAVTSHVPVVAANAGTVVNASWLGIYGNCVIIDHGMGVQSLYGHLSSFDVKVGDRVTRGQTIGRSGMTGLAGGDHLHFTMLVNGRMVNPVEWWDAHWIQDRVLRKLGETSGAAASSAGR